jgi:hypothetical protein
MTMHYIGVIGFTAFGVLCLILSIWHEYKWHKRSHWKFAIGVIIDFKVDADADGTTYAPIIEYRSSTGKRSFTSNYSSSGKAQIGSDAKIIISEDGLDAEHYSFSNRWLFTIIPIVFGIIFISVGLNIQPIQNG